MTMQGYRDGKFTCLITTNVCARGVDIPEVDLVINAEPPSDVETYIHRSGRTGRAGRNGSCVTFYKADQEYLIENIRKKAGVDFTKISAPQPAEIVSARASQTIHEIDQVDPLVFKYFESASEKLLQHFQGDAIKAMSACFSLICGTTKPLQSRSLLTANEGWRTVLFQTSKVMRNIGYVKSIFSAQTHPSLDVFKDMIGWRLTADSKGVVVDVNEEKMVVDENNSIIIAGVKWINGKGISAEIASELPPLQANFGNASGRGRGGSASSFNKRGGFGGGFGGGRGGYGGGSRGSRGGGRGGSRGGFGGGRGRGSYY
jgi:ATP-dependent RNA helicase DDX21